MKLGPDQVFLPYLKLDFFMIDSLMKDDLILNSLIKTVVCFSKKVQKLSSFLRHLEMSSVCSVWLVPSIQPHAACLVWNDHYLSEKACLPKRYICITCIFCIVLMNQFQRMSVFLNDRVWLLEWVWLDYKI